MHIQFIFAPSIYHSFLSSMHTHDGIALVFGVAHILYTYLHVLTYHIFNYIPICLYMFTFVRVSYSCIYTIKFYLSLSLSLDIYTYVMYPFFSLVGAHRFGQDGQKVLCVHSLDLQKKCEPQPRWYQRAKVVQRGCFSQVQ